MNITPDALALSVIWAKKFNPWLWDFKTKRWNSESIKKGGNLLKSNQEQIQYALLNGWSPYAIQDAIKSADKKVKVNQIYKLLVLSDNDDDYSVHNYIESDKLCHKALFNGLISKGTFMIEDLVKYQQPLFDTSDQTKWALHRIALEKGIDNILFAIDIAKQSDVKLNTPWGLKIFMDQADIDRKARIARLKGLAIESEATRGSYK